MPEVRTYKYYSGGEWRAATSGRVLDVHEPFSGQLYARVAVAGATTRGSRCRPPSTGSGLGLTPRFDEASAMTSDRPILITGVTGNQGGAVAQALQGTGFHLRGLTRMPDSERAAGVGRPGVAAFQG
jgi:NmrA-like family